MFYADIFTHEEKQKILKLVDDRLISTHIPECLKTSHHVLRIKRVEMRSSSRVNAEHSILPCINPQIPIQLISAMMKGDIAMNRERLSMLFELGLGVPKQPEVAAFLRTYESDADEDGSGLRSLRKLIVNYQDMIETQFSESDRMYTAAYMAKLLDFASFIGQGESSAAVKAPAGIPVVLVYYTSDHTVGQFKLVDAFDIKGGVLRPFAHIAMRPFANIPNVLTSQNLARATSYTLVFGVLTGGQDLEHFVQMLGSDDLDVVISCNPEIVSQEFADKLQNCKPQERDSLARRTAHKFGSSSPLAKAEFIALDVGLIDRNGRIRANTAPLAKTSRILKKIGFETKSKSVNKMQTFKYGGSPRVWTIEES